MNAKLEPEKDAYNELVEEAWRLVEDALKTGVITLDSGEVVKLSPAQVVAHMQWVAALGKKKPKTTPVLKDKFLLNRTDLAKPDPADPQ